jgi:aminodeoxyfutalosine synthase
MSTKLISSALRPIYEKVVASGRVTDAEALALYASNDLNGLGTIANVLRERKNGNVATYIRNQYINYSNVCLLSCQFCAFGAKKRDTHAFELGIDEILEKVRHGLSKGVTEVHMVGGLHPSLKGEWYLDLLRGLRALDPQLFIKAFTAIEIRHLAERVFREPIRSTLERLREAGLGAITGGGAEIFAPEIREQICRGKESAEEWLEVHRTWHELGMRSTATMLFGHIETAAHRVDHLRRLRELQGETRGFTGFIPFAFEPEGARADSVLVNLPHATAFEELRNLAISRIYLDNFDHITAYWVSLGLPLAQQALNYGVDDLHGTIMEEKIFHMAGAQTPQGQTADTMERAIREAGREPMQRDTWYRRIQPAQRAEALACA